MNRHFFDEETIRRERLLDLYVWGLDRGDAEAVTSALEAALTDPQLSRLMDEINLAYEEEEQLTPMAEDSKTVRSLLRQHIPSAFESEPQEAPQLTVRDAASHLQSKSRIPILDEEAHRLLLSSDAPLPIQLSQIEIKRLAEELNVRASDLYWKRFQQSAVALWMSRSQKQAQLAARAKRKSKDAAQRKSKNRSDSNSEEKEK